MKRTVCVCEETCREGVLRSRFCLEHAGSLAAPAVYPFLHDTPQCVTGGFECVAKAGDGLPLMYGLLSRSGISCTRSALTLSSSQASLIWLPLTLFTRPAPSIMPTPPWLLSTLQMHGIWLSYRALQMGEPAPFQAACCHFPSHHSQSFVKITRLSCPCKHPVMTAELAATDQMLASFPGWS